MAAPPLGITARARMLRVIDGDTVDVQLEIPVRVRLKDCWAPELHGDDKIAGEKAKTALQLMAPVGTHLIVHVPTQEVDALAGVFTFGRVIADVYVREDDDSLNEHLVQMGHATREKRRDN